MPCESPKYVGREVALEFVIDCGDTMPAEEDWKLFGAGRTKSINPTWDTVDATADDTVGNIRTNLATWLAFEISADGVCRRSDSANSNQTELLKHFLNPAQTGGQPIIVVRVTMPDVTIVTAVLMSEFTREFPYDDVATWSISMSATDSTIGMVVTDTPVVPDPTGP